MDIIVKTIYDMLSREGRAIAETWFSVIAHGPKAVVGHPDLDTGGVLAYGLRFMLYMVLAELIVKLPIAALLKIEYGNPAYVISYTVATCIEYLSACLFLHGALRLVGGQAPLWRSVAAFCFMTAYLPLGAIAHLPIQHLIAQVMREVDDPGGAIAAMERLAQTASAWEVFVLVAAWLVSTIIVVLFVSSVFRSLRAIHRLSRGRALPAFALGLMSYLLFVVVFVAPAFAAISGAFVRG